jgi:hypothetical protein
MLFSKKNVGEGVGELWWYQMIVHKCVAIVQNNIHCTHSSTSKLVHGWRWEPDQAFGRYGLVLHNHLSE